MRFSPPSLDRLFCYRGEGLWFSEKYFPPVPNAVCCTLPLFIRFPFIIPEYLQCWLPCQPPAAIYHPFNRIGLPRNWKFNKSRVRMINWLIPSQLCVRLCVRCREHFVMKLHFKHRIKFSYPLHILIGSLAAHRLWTDVYWPRVTRASDWPCLSLPGDTHWSQPRQYVTSHIGIGNEEYIKKGEKEKLFNFVNRWHCL